VTEPDRDRPFDATGAVMQRLGYSAAGGPLRRRRAIAVRLTQATALVALVSAAIAWWGARARAQQQGPAVGDAIRGSVATGAGRLEAILLGMPRAGDAQPALSADSTPSRSGQTY